MWRRRLCLKSPPLPNKAKFPQKFRNHSSAGEGPGYLLAYPYLGEGRSANTMGYSSCITPRETHRSPREAQLTA